MSLCLIPVNPAPRGDLVRAVPRAMLTDLARRRLGPVWGECSRCAGAGDTGEVPNLSTTVMHGYKGEKGMQLNNLANIFNFNSNKIPPEQLLSHSVWCQCHLPKALFKPVSAKD